MSKRFITFGSILLLGICVLVIILALWLFSFNEGNTNNSPLNFLSDPPTVIINQPTRGTVISSSEGVIVTGTAQSDAGIGHVEFLVDGVVKAEYDPLVSQPSLDVAFPWFGSQSGWHELGLIAYDVNGRPSEMVSVQVGVVAVSAEGNGHMPEAGQSAENADQAGAEGEAQANGADAAEAENPADGNNPEADAAIPLPELPPQPADAPPALAAFSANAQIVGGAVQVIVHGQAVDDLGVNRLVLRWQNGAELSDFTVLCGDVPLCEMNESMDLGNGQTTFSLQAIDTSGQASEVLFDMTEVFLDADQPPAVAEHDLDLGLVAAELLDAGPMLIHEGLVAEGFDPHDLFQILGRMNQAEESACAPGDIVCEMGEGIDVSVEAHPDGNLITIRVLKPFEAPDGLIIVPNVRRAFPDFTAGKQLLPHEWVDLSRTALQAGEEFTVFDTDVVCDDEYAYTGKLMAYDALAVAGFTGAGMQLPRGETLAYEEQQALSQVCGADAIGALNLRAESDGTGRITLNWTLPANANYPQEGVGVMLYRVNRAEVAHPVTVFEEIVAFDNVQNGKNFEFADNDVKCGERYKYALGVYPASAHPPQMAEGWLAHNSVSAPDHFCPAGALADLEMNLVTEWEEGDEGHYPVLSAHVKALPSFAYPAGSVVFRPWISYIDENGNEIKKNTESLLVVDRQILPDISFEYEMDCSVESYRFSLTLDVDGERINEIISETYLAPECPPRVPVLQELQASNDCADGVERCIYLRWTLYQDVDGDDFAPASEFLVSRQEEFFPNQFGWTGFHVELADTTFMDYGLECGAEYAYRLTISDERGLSHTHSDFSESPILRITTPSCDEPWNLIVNAESE